MLTLLAMAIVQVPATVRAAPRHDARIDAAAVSRGAPARKVRLPAATLPRLFTTVADSGRDRRVQQTIGAVTVGLEGAIRRDRPGRRSAAPQWLAGVRGPSGRLPVKRALAALDAAWQLGSEGRVSIAAGVDRTRLTGAMLARGGEAATMTTVAAAYDFGRQWQLSGGWRSTGGRRETIGDRLVALSAGSPVHGAGPFAALRLTPAGGAEERPASLTLSLSQTWLTSADALAHGGAGAPDTRGLVTLVRRFR